MMVLKVPRSFDPFRRLVYLEWFILAIVMLMDVLIPMPFLRFPEREPWLTVFCTTAFAITGLPIFQKTQRHKATTFFIALLLILTATFRGGSRLFTLLYIVLVIRAWNSFQIWKSLVATSLILGCFGMTVFVLTRDPYLLDYENLTSNSKRWGSSLILAYVILFTLSTLFAALVTRLVVDQRRSREKLAIANEQLRQYALRIEDQATLQERNRIAREIHDSLGHALTGLNLQLETALKLWAAHPNTAREFLTNAKSLSATALKDVRESVAMMRSAPLQSQSLEDALQALMNHFSRSTGIQPASQIQLPSGLSIELQLAIYRIVQEALTNICKYSHATTVAVEVNVFSAHFPQLGLTIQDNGDGFDVSKNTTGFGLQGMRERALALHGIFQIHSHPGQGCKIQATFPLAHSLLHPS
jgi:signal transduction histidine kinase